MDEEVFEAVDDVAARRADAAELLLLDSAGEADPPDIERVRTGR